MKEKSPEEKQLFLMKLQTAMIGLILILILAAVIFLAGRVNEVMETVRQVDISQVNKAVGSLKEAAETLSQVDMNALNSGIQDLSGAAEDLSQLDFQKLTRFMDSLEDLSTQMDAVSSFFKTFMRK